MNNSPRQQVGIAATGWVVVSLLLAICFGSILIGQSAFGFRDTASYFGPMHEWVADQRLANGSIEWNPYDNWGGPVLADGTPGVYYPPQLLFLLKPFVSISVLLGWFAMLHVFWAALGTVFCCRKLGIGSLAGWMTALSFAFGGAVLFQTCNLIFLISAAWLPWALAAIVGFCSEGRLIHLPYLAIFMSLMILGGDPQMAVHVMMIAATAWVLFPITPSGFGQGEVVSGNGVLPRKLGFAAVTVVAFVAAALAMIQIGPSVEWTQHSERAAWENESNIVETKLARPTPGTHRDAVYQFSLPPWSLTEFLWPNSLGKLDYGTNVRWSSRFPGSDRIWTGSLYGGAFVFLLAVVNFWKRRDGHRSRDRIDRLLFFGAAFFIVGAFGWYGVAWLVNELQLMRGGAGINHWLGEPVGGLYWFLECFVPGYSSFRYPAKLLVVGSLFVCLSAGRGMDRVLFEATAASDGSAESIDGLGAVRGSFTVLLKKFLWVLIAGSVFLAVGIFFSSFDATDEICQALVHSIVVLLVFVSILRLLPRRPSLASFCLLLLLSVDLGVANYWLVAKVPAVQQAGDLTEPLIDEGEVLFRRGSVDDYSALPNGNDLATQLKLDKQSLYPKHHLNHGVRVVGSFHSIQPLDSSLLLQAMNDLTGQQLESVCEALSIDGMIQHSKPAKTGRRQAFAIEPYSGRSRFYLTNSWEWLPPVDSRSRAAVTKQTESFIEWSFRNRHQLIDTVLVEASQQQFDEAFRELDRGTKPSLAPALVQVVDQTMERIQLKVVADQPMLLVAADYFHPDWKARIIRGAGPRRFELQTFRVNRVLRGVPVPAGEHRIELSYEPENNGVYCLISCLAWVLVWSSIVALHRRARH